MAELVCRAATANDLRQFYEGRPHPTLKALVVCDGQRLLGIVGLAREGVRSKFFSEIREDLRPSLKKVICLRTILRARELVRASKLPVFAIAQADEPDAHRLLQRLGFVHLQDEVYQWPR